MTQSQSKVCGECEGTGRTSNHVTGEVECGACEGTGYDEPQSQSTDDLVKRLRGDPMEIDRKTILAAAATIGRLQADLAARDKTIETMREDAERLKFLCSRMFTVELSPDGHHKWIFRNNPLEGANVQAAIDAARSK